MAKRKKKMGRPSAYRPAMNGLANKFCMLGATNDQLAKFFEVGASAIDVWIATKPAFSKAVKAGRMYADANAAESLYRSALGYEHPSEEIHVIDKEVVRVPITKKYPPHPTSLIFWLKNRQPALWRDRVEHEHSGPLKTISDEKLEAAIATLRKLKTDKEGDEE